uniref:Uncharacterized protein n=1 Tax=Arundo donax TaxID=35708 RepID=A0A0A9HXZ7_ARUDO
MCCSEENHGLISSIAKSDPAKLIGCVFLRLRSNLELHILAIKISSKLKTRCKYSLCLSLFLRGTRCKYSVSLTGWSQKGC